MDWYIVRARVQSGPYTLAFVRDAAAGGALSRHDLVWRPGWADWREAGSVDGIFDVPHSMANPESSSRTGHFTPPPGAADPVPPALISAPPRPAGETPQGRSNYLLRHWRGELSLPMAYWVSGIAVGVLGRINAGVVESVVAESDVSASLYALMLAWVVLFDLAMTAWLMVGIWRSASRHRSRGGRVLWAWVAKGIVIMVAVATPISLWLKTWPEVSESIQIALGIDESSEHGFRLSKDGTELEFSGPITVGTARDFAQALDAAPQVGALHLSSPGGVVSEAGRIAAKATKRGLVTYVSDECSSACTDIFLAGRERWIGDRAKLGFHRASYDGSVSYMASALARDERRHLISLGIPADFAEKAASRAGAAIWYPTHDELLRAHVISGIAKKGQFANFGEPADIAAALLRVPIYASLKKRIPEIFEALVGAVSEQYQAGAPAEEILIAAEKRFPEVVNLLLPHAPDRLVLEHTSIYVGFMDKLKSMDPQSCAALAEVDGAELKVDLKRQFPELTRRELAFSESLVASTDPGRPIPTESQVGPHLSEVLTKMHKQFGDDADLLGKDAYEPREYKRLCEVLVGFYREIMRLPSSKAADVLRYVYSER
jgi:hypothetical protein